MPAKKGSPPATAASKLRLAMGNADTTDAAARDADQAIAAQLARYEYDSNPAYLVRAFVLASDFDRPIPPVVMRWLRDGFAALERGGYEGDLQQLLGLASKQRAGSVIKRKANEAAKNAMLQAFDVLCELGLHKDEAAALACQASVNVRGADLSWSVEHLLAQANRRRAKTNAKQLLQVHPAQFRFVFASFGLQLPAGALKKVKPEYMERHKAFLSMFVKH
jgi:hypothetical protein